MSCNFVCRYLTFTNIELIRLPGGLFDYKLPLWGEFLRYDGHDFNRTTLALRYCISYQTTSAKSRNFYKPGRMSGSNPSEYYSEKGQVWIFVYVTLPRPCNVGDVVSPRRYDH